MGLEVGLPSWYWLVNGLWYCDSTVECVYFEHSLQMSSWRKIGSRISWNVMSDQRSGHNV